MSKETNTTAYVVLSCDPYSDIWDVYGQLFERFWPDCPFDLYLASHHKSFDKYGFKPILLGEDISWSHGLIVLIDKLEELGYTHAMIAGIRDTWETGLRKNASAYRDGIRKSCAGPSACRIRERKPLRASTPWFSRTRKIRAKPTPSGKR